MPVLSRPASKRLAKPCERTADDIDAHLHTGDVDARKTRGFFVTADGVHVTAESRLRQQEVTGQDDAEHDDHRHGNSGQADEPPDSRKNRSSADGVEGRVVDLDRAAAGIQEGQNRAP